MYGIFSTILNMSLTGSVVIVLVLAARFLLRKAPKMFSYALWAVVLFRLLCPVSLPSPLSLLGLINAPVAENSGPVSRVEYIPNVTESLQEDSISHHPETQALPQPSETELPTDSTLDFGEIAAWVWLAGASSLCIVGLVRYFRFRKHLTGAYHLRQNLYLVDHIDTAFVLGLFRPKIYLPSGLPEAQMGYIIAHEEYHIRRLDFIVKHLAFLALCIHWFNPLCWAAFFFAGKDMEMSCDEAVIRKLGPDIRADYSATLLRLASGQSIIPTAPLAFGEGDTKGRIKNMANWKHPKKWVVAICCVLCMGLLIVCAANPIQGTSFNSTFANANGSVQFQMDIETVPDAKNLSVFKAAPMDITSEMIQTVAKALLGDAAFYEREPSSSPQYSKSQYEAMLDRLEPYSNLEAMTELVGPMNAEEQLEQVTNSIAAIREAMKTAPEENPLTPCDWKLKKERVYNDTADEIAGRSPDEDNDWLVATAEKDGIGYKYMVVRQNQGDLKLNRFLLQLGGASVDSHTDRQIYWSKLCRTGDPTPQQIQDVNRKVLTYLSKMDLGQWEIAETKLEVYDGGAEPEYTLRVQAVPVLSGVPTVGSQSDDQNGTYAPTKADFLMSVNGDLIQMELDTPLVIQANEPVALSPVSELMDRIQKELAISEAGDYGMSADQIATLERSSQEEITCFVTIDQAEYRLARALAEDGTGICTYVPVLAVGGTIEYRGETTQTVYHKNTLRDLLSISALESKIVR